MFFVYIQSERNPTVEVFFLEKVREKGKVPIHLLTEYGLTVIRICILLIVDVNIGFDFVRIPDIQ